MKRQTRTPTLEPLPEIPGDFFGAALLRAQPELLRELAHRRVSLGAVLYILEQALSVAVHGGADRKLRRKHQEGDVVPRSFRDWGRRLRALCADAEVIRNGDRIAALLEELEKQLAAAAVGTLDDGRPAERNRPSGSKARPAPSGSRRLFNISNCSTYRSACAMSWCRALEVEAEAGLPSDAAPSSRLDSRHFFRDTHKVFVHSSLQAGERARRAGVRAWRT
jgi:hypothetical protein